ncbi:MAG: CPBP family intramembrane metalloprotease [Planctomycetes bacterium]|nr:CPBP family intramembrane metalloprotease [Planctomycetota bacterium]
MILAIFKLLIAIPIISGMAILVAAMANLMYDPGKMEEPGELDKQVLPLANPVLLAALMFLLFGPLVMAWLQQLFWADSGPPSVLLSSAVILVLTAMFLGVFTRRWPAALPFSWRRQPVIAYCLFLPLLAAVSVVNRILMEDVGGVELPWQVVSGFDELSGWPLAGALLMVIVLVPWLEEIIFRHFVWGALLKHPGFGVARALIFSSLAFTVLHPPTMWLPVFFLGFFLAWVRWRSCRLADAVVIHQLHNLVVVLLLTDLSF